jgi:glycine cleavage system aminomethyltransferase T
MRHPRSRELVGDLFGDEAAGLGYYRFTRASADGIPVIVTRTGWTGELGYEVYLLDPARGTDLWEQIMQAGRSYQIRPVGPSDIRRVEVGILNWGADMTYENNPYEVGLGRLVDLDSEADFLARPALTRIRDHGVRRRLAGVQIDGPRLAMNTTKWPVSSGTDRVGQVTSALCSPRLECNIGYAWVPAELAEPGTQLRVDTEAGGERPATVVPVPFIDPGKQTPKA